MSEELLGVIITSGVTSIISVIGFIVTYKSMKRNFKEELEKEKTMLASGEISHLLSGENDQSQSDRNNQCISFSFL